ncbi:N-acetylglucosamine 6-phosphate deacetylase [Spirosomataceae bacterium TFI 002]|nr:N-acetylglucosamine 6-phosphate deacetylase [Spirosomataceae bacterium TFI 002]
MKKVTAQKVYTNNQILSNVSISIEKGKIVSVDENSAQAPLDYDCLAPAFFDTHINGGEDLYFTQSNNHEVLADIANSSAKYGTAYTLPAFITSSLENILKGLEVTRKFMNENPDAGVLGMHLEGPFLNIKKRGAHLAKYVRMPTNEEIKTILDAGADVIKIWTIAPENFTAEQISMIKDAGIVISAGHSNATYEESKKAFAQGISLCTHLYNAMSPFHHRDPGLIGAVLENKAVWAPIIPDGIHCDFGAARIAYQAKPDRLFIISDALFLSRKKQSFKWEEFDAFLVNDEYKNSEGNLAGSAISMSEAVQNTVKHIEVPLKTALSMATDRAAEAVGMQKLVGTIAKGYPSKFVHFSEQELNFELLCL